MSRRRRRGGGATGPASVAPETLPANAPQALQTWLAAQFGPVLEAEKAWFRNPQPQVIVLPRTTQYMSESERLRRAVSFGRQKPAETISFDSLRAISRYSLVNAVIHSRRRQQLRKLGRKYDGRKNKPGWAIVHKRHFDHTFDATTVEGLADRIRRIERLFEQPHPEYDTHLGALLSKMTEDHLALDRVCLNTLRAAAARTDTPNPYPVVQFAHVDGATIWPADVYLDRFCRLNGIVTAGGNPDYDLGLRHLYEFNGVDLRDVRYVQVDQTQGGDTPRAFLRSDDVRLYIANPSPEMRHWAFGVSPAESSYNAASLLLHGISYVATFFRDAFSEMVGILSGSTYKNEDAQTIANILRTHHAGIGNQHRTPIIRLDGQPGDLVFQPTRQHSATDMEFSETIHRATMWIHGHYNMHPGETFTDPNSPSGPSKLQDSNHEQELDIARDEGLFAIADGFAEDIFTPMVEEWDPDLMFVFLGLDEKSDQAELDMRQKRAQGWLAPNEARKEENTTPVILPAELVACIGGLQPFDLPGPAATAAFQAVIGAASQQHQMAMQQAMGIQPGQGQPGQDGPPEGEDSPPPDQRPQQLQWQPHEPGDDGDDGAADDQGDEPGKAVSPRIEFVVRERPDHGS